MEMNSEIYHPINLIDCECSINSIDYNATDLIVELERFDNKGIVRVERSVRISRDFGTFQNYRGYGWLDFTASIYC
jgi:hypothetical protein